MRFDPSFTPHATRPPSRKRWRSTVPEVEVEPLSPNPTILPLEELVRNHASTVSESSPQVDAELTMRDDDDPPKAIARSASPAMAPGRPRVAPEPTLAFTAAVAPLRLTFATGPATL